MPVRFARQTSELCAQRFVESEGLTGPFHFELAGLKSADHRIYFLEINCRLGGTTAKVMQLGYDEPGLLLEGLQPSAAAASASAVQLYSRTTTVKPEPVQAFDLLRNRRDPLPILSRRGCGPFLPR